MYELILYGGTELSDEPGEEPQPQPLWAQSVRANRDGLEALLEIAETVNRYQTPANGRRAVVVEIVPTYRPVCGNDEQVQEWLRFTEES